MLNGSQRSSLQAQVQLHMVCLPQPKFFTFVGQRAVPTESVRVSEALRSHTSMVWAGIC